MNSGFNNVFRATVLLLAFLALAPAHAQNPAPIPAPLPADNAIRPPVLPPEMDPNSPLGQVVQMLQSGTAEKVVLTYINNSSGPFDLNVTDVTYLNDLGTPLDIQTAMVQRNQKLDSSAEAQSTATPPSDQTQDAQEVTEDYFYEALAPYGTWINLPGYGLCWQPCAATYDANWMPYGTQGQWAFTDDGWYWLSSYSWGWSVFHYGRWFHDAQHGWCWWPSTMWAPSWVFWRYEGSYAGWAPLPPHCYYGQQSGTASNGLLYNGAAVAANYDFGMGAELFNFVPMANLFDGNSEHFRLSTAQARKIFAKSKVLNNISSNDRTLANGGIPLGKIAMATGGAMRSFTLQPAKSVALPGARGEQILPDGKTLAIERPYFNTSVPSALKQGVWPIAGHEQPVAHQTPTIVVNENPLNYPPADNQSSVIYVDSAGQNGTPVPTVTTDGLQDYPANATSGGEPAQSYWAGFAAGPAPVDSSSAYLSPRLQSHQHWSQKVQQPTNHREFNPSTGGIRPVQHQEGHTAGPEPRNTNPQHSSAGTNKSSSPPHSSMPNAPAHTGSSAPASGQNHERGEN